MSSIGASAFRDCSGLTSIWLPPNLVAIERNAFYGCSGLTSIKIPASVRALAESAFAQCVSLESVYYLGESDPGDGDVSIFDGCDKLNFVCVSGSFSSQSLSGRSISCQSDLCGSQCVDITGSAKACVSWTKPNVENWLAKSTECTEYLCDDEKGLITRNNCTNNVTICKEDKCVEVEDDKRFAVVIE